MCAWLTCPDDNARQRDRTNFTRLPPNDAGGQIQGLVFRPCGMVLVKRARTGKGEG